jgi:hypothetical protein
MSPAEGSATTQIIYNKNRNPCVREGKVHENETFIHQNCTCFRLPTSSYSTSTAAEENVSMSVENENGWMHVTLSVTITEYIYFMLFICLFLI